MTNRKEETVRERLQRREHQKHPVGNAKDVFDRAQSGMPDTRGMKAKELGGTILLIILIFI